MSDEGRYRIYRLEDGEPALIAEAPTYGGLGLALVTLAEEGDITSDDRVGILDRPDRAKPGRWIVNPWAAPSARPTTNPS